MSSENLLASRLEVVVQEGGEPDGGIVGRVRSAEPLHRDGVFEHALDVDADGRHGQQAEGRERRVTAADVGFSVNDGAPVVLAGDMLELGVRVGDGYETRAGAFCPQVGAYVLPAHVGQHGGLNRGARLARDDVERASRIGRTENVVDVDR